MKRALATVCTEGYVYFLTALLKSIIKNSAYRDEFIVFVDDTMTATLKDTLSSIYPRIVFVDVPVEAFHKAGKYRKQFYGLMAFGLEGYDRVVYLGADMICLKPFEDIFNVPGPLSMTRELARPSTLNSGAMVISREIMGPDVFASLLKISYPDDYMPEIYGSDQRLIQIYFKGRINVHDNKYNALVTETNHLPIDRAVFLHYVVKPNHPTFINRCGREAFDLWADINNAEVTW